jgi:hypothetical protein
MTCSDHTAALARPAPHDPTADCPVAAAASLPDRTAWRLALLERLAELAMQRAEAVALAAPRPAAPEASDGAQAADPAEERDAAGAKAELDFCRVARAVRLTLALHAKFEDEYRARLIQAAADRAALAADSAKRAAEAERRRFGRTRERAERELERAIDSRADPTEAESLRADLQERLDDPEFEAQLGDWPFDEVVLSLCDHIGLPPDWTDWGPPPEQAAAAEAAGLVLDCTIKCPCDLCTLRRQQGSAAPIPADGRAGPEAVSPEPAAGGRGPPDG